MQSYILTSDAERELEKIWHYSYNQWGIRQADRYLHLLEKVFRKIAKNTIIAKKLSTNYPDIYSVRCQQHYIFYLEGKVPVIFAVLHEKMDLIARLNKQLG